MQKKRGKKIENVELKLNEVQTLICHLKMIEQNYTMVG